jgi:hypothetical protein
MASLVGCTCPRRDASRIPKMNEQLGAFGTSGAVCNGSSQLSQSFITDYPKAKRALQEIWMAETRKEALAAFDAFVETWSVKYDKAIECPDQGSRRRGGNP